MEQHRLRGHRAEVVAHRHSGARQRGRKHLAAESSLHSDQNGCANGPESHRRALHHHPEHDRRGRREAQRHEERSRDGRRRPEARSAFDEGAEQPGDDHDLNASVVADPVEGPANRRHAARPLQRVEQQDRAEDDEEEVEGQEETLDRGGGHPRWRHLPRAQRDRDGGDVDRRHRVFRGDSKADQKYAAESNGE